MKDVAVDKTPTMTAEKAFEEDVKRMSYEELMEAIRWLDQERRHLADHVHDEALETTKNKRLQNA